MVDAYETDKDILTAYGDTVTLKRRRDDEDEDDEPFAGSNRGSKRRKARKEPESTSAPKDKTSKSTGLSKEGSKSKTRSIEKSAQVEEQKPAKPPTPDRDWNKTFLANHGPIQPWISTLARNEDPRSCKSLVELEYFLEEVYKATTDQLYWNNPKGQKYPHDLRKPLPLIPNSRGRRVIPFDHFINNDLAYLSVNRESARDDYSRNRIIAIKKLAIVEWHNYKHLAWITVCKLTNLNIEERLALGVSLRMFTRSIVIKRRMEDLQLESRQEVQIDAIDELHKLSDGTLNDVRSALDDNMKRIQMKYLPQTI
ncbi:hypothetical protein Tco_1447339 [Tanacetum coccineum]